MRSSEASAGNTLGVEDGSFMATRLEVTELGIEGVTVFLAAGDLDLASAPSLCETLAQRRGQRVVLDLSTTGFCDLAGMRAIRDEARAGRAAGGLFAIVAPEGSAARRLLEVAGLMGAVEIHEDQPRAIARVRPPR
jgi:anti-anti-sigma factor